MTLERLTNQRRLPSPERGNHTRVIFISDAPGTVKTFFKELSIRMLEVQVPPQGEFVEVKTVGLIADFILPTKQDHPAGLPELPSRINMPNSCRENYCPFGKATYY